MKDKLLKVAADHPYAVTTFAVLLVALFVLFYLPSYARLFKLDKLLPFRKAPTSLDKKEWRNFELVDREEVTHDVRRFRFKLPSKEHVLGLPVGSHVNFQFVGKDGNEVKRSYTPISSDDDRGYADFIIKVYNPSKREMVDKGTGTKKVLDIPGGSMSMHLDSLKIGQSIAMKGPVGELLYLGCGQFNIKNKHRRTFRRLGLIAGGSGITPILQLIRAILKDPKDKTEISLIFANQSEQDILLQDELEALPKKRVKIWFTVDRLKAIAEKEWKYGVGFITKAMIEQRLPKNDGDTLFVACGPPPMYKFAVVPAFADLEICSANKKEIQMSQTIGVNSFINTYEEDKNYYLC